MPRSSSRLCASSRKLACGRGTLAMTPPSRPNSTFDRTAGSHSLAAAGQRGRSAHMGRYPALLVLLVAVVVLDACSIRLPDRGQTELACPSVAGDDYYFPVSALDSRDPHPWPG